MIKFLVKGVLNDKNRSLFPVLIVGAGVFLTVFLVSWIAGVMGDSVDLMAKFTSGHVRIMTRAYADNESQFPNDLALLGTAKLMEELKSEYPEMDWVERIRFGGLMDVPDEKGETRSQGPVAGMAVDLLSEGSKEINRMNIAGAIKKGKLPQKPGEALISDEFATKLRIKPGDVVTLFGSTMYGAMTFYNFKISGTVKFGTAALDRGSLIIDLSDAKNILDMADGASEILGYSPDGVYDDEKAMALASDFNSRFSNPEDEFSPVMQRLKEQGGMADSFVLIDNMSFILTFIFVLLLSIVLWNTGLLNGLRRYNEFGVRLAMGENKGHIYRTLITESVVIGFIGSVLGTVLGLGVSYLLQENGIDFSKMLKDTGSSMMLPNVYRAVITPQAFYIGFIPGVLSMMLGNMLSGIGIYRRKTAMLFKELEV